MARESHPEDFCKKCGRPNVVWFAPNEMWNKYVRDNEPGILCPVCFIQLVEREGVSATWSVAPQDYYLRSWQPIESAPKDGRTLLLGYFNPLNKWRTVRGQWFTDEEIGEWENGEDFESGWYETPENMDEPPNCFLIAPAHWMPLPSPPK